MEIVVIKSDITALEVDAVVRPSTEGGDIVTGGSGSSSRKILERGGASVSAALTPLLPIRIGQAAMTVAGQLPCRYVIHSPTSAEASRGPTLDDVKKAMLAAIRCAEDNALRSVAFPDMGLDGDSSTRSRAARAIVAMLNGFQTNRLSRVLLVDTNEETIRAYEHALEALRE